MDCRFKNLFGFPGKGIHSIRMFDVAIVDVLLTLMVAYGISRYFRVAFPLVAGGLLMLGVTLHWLFCVPTSVNVYLGLIK